MRTGAKLLQNLWINQKRPAVTYTNIPVAVGLRKHQYQMALTMLTDFRKFTEEFQKL